MRLGPRLHKLPDQREAARKPAPASPDSRAYRAYRAYRERPPGRRHRPMLSRLLIALVRLYQRTLSPLLVAALGPVCRFEPSCSRYAVACLEGHGALRGALLSVKRLCRCHPFHPGGHDPPPPPRIGRPAASPLRLESPGQRGDGIDPFPGHGGPRSALADEGKALSSGKPGAGAASGPEESAQPPSTELR